MSVPNSSLLDGVQLPYTHSSGEKMINIYNAPPNSDVCLAISHTPNSMNHFARFVLFFCSSKKNWITHVAHVDVLYIERYTYWQYHIALNFIVQVLCSKGRDTRLSAPGQWHGNVSTKIGFGDGIYVGATTHTGWRANWTEMVSFLACEASPSVDSMCVAFKRCAAMGPCWDPPTTPKWHSTFRPIGVATGDQVNSATRLRIFMGPNLICRIDLR